jgi:hypothetical protein
VKQNLLKRKRLSQRKPHLLQLNPRRRSKPRKVLVKVMRLLSAETVAMNLFSLLERRHSTSRRGSTTLQSVARHAKMPRKDGWKVAEEVGDVVEEEAEVIVMVGEEEEESAMPSKKANATVAMIAASLTVVPVEGEVEEEEVAVVDVVEHLEDVVVEEEVSVTPTKRANAPVGPPADTLTSKFSCFCSSLSYPDD